MKELFRSALHWLADTRLARSVADTIFRGLARRRILELDQTGLVRAQNRTLLGLVHRARQTRFAHDHDFPRIRTASDFRRLVPLRTPAELWREYWQPAFPNLAGATWPGPIPYLAISSAQLNGSFPYVPISPDLWAAQQTAALTSLAFVLHARPRSRLCSGRLLLLGGGTTLTPPGDFQPPDSLEAIAIRELPAVLRPYACTVSPTDRESDDQPLHELAERSIATPVTCIAGSIERLVPFLTRIQRLTGRERLADIWPSLVAVLYARGPTEPDRAHLESVIASPEVLCLEMVFRPEGAIAIEDPRHHRLRLLPDLGVYFEFVPVDQVGKPRPERYSAGQVKRGIPYALALSSPAGVWACLVGSVVRFEQENPPLLHLVESCTPWELAARAEPLPGNVGGGRAFPTQPPHMRPAALPGRPFRGALAIRKD
ncbi:MAG TPA: GH3 auxin-responsive promoter family protein [Gemmataceae bacterium]|nr:GH3 auxin-responsive promoter family protein [Gemmataceae bacterium]